MNINFFELVCFHLLVLSGKSMSADECGFTVTNSSERKIEFNTLLNSGMKIIYIDVLILDDELYTNNSNYNLKQESGLLRWVWTKNEMSFLLSYTEDIHAISFNLLKGAYIEDFTIDIDIFPAGCNFDYQNDTKALFNLIHDTFVQNESDWQLCHRYFDNQEWKVTLFNFTSYWVGYGMECFKPSCRAQLTSCETKIEKSFINYLIIIFLIGIFVYSPVLLFFFPEKIAVKNIENRLQNYNSFDTPYSVSRLLLNLNKQQKNEESYSVIFGSVTFSQENKVITLFVIISSTINILYRQLSTNFNEDWKKYEHIYLPYDITLSITNYSIGAYLFIYFIIFGFFAVCISMQIRILRKSKSVYFILSSRLHSRMKYVDIDKLLQNGNQKQEKNRHDSYGYTVFVLSILNRVALLFSCTFYVSLMKPLRRKFKGNRCKRFWKFIGLFLITLINLILNICMSAFPIIYCLFGPMLFIICASKSVAKTFLLFVWCVINTISSVMVCRYLFLSALSILLRFVIFNVFIIIPAYRVSFKFWTLVVTVFSYLRIFYKDFYDPYNELLKICMSFSNITNQEDMRTNKTSSDKASLNQIDLDDVTVDNRIVSVKTYRMIANTVYPIRMQIAFLIGKLLCLTVIITAIAHVMGNDVGDDSFVDQYLPLILFTVTPAVAMKLNNKDPSEHVEKYSQFIKETMARSEKRGTEDTSGIGEEKENKSNDTDIENKLGNTCPWCKCNLSKVTEGSKYQIFYYFFVFVFVFPLSFYLLMLVVIFSIKDCFSCKCTFDDEKMEDKQYVFQLHTHEEEQTTTTDERNNDNHIVLLSSD